MFRVRIENKKFFIEIFPNFFHKEDILSLLVLKLYSRLKCGIRIFE